MRRARSIGACRHGWAKKAREADPRNPADLLEDQLWAPGVLIVREHRFHPRRRFRFDLAWPEAKLAVEVDGGGFIMGRHSRGLGIENDCEKNLLASSLGWRVLRCTPRQVKNGMAAKYIREALSWRG